MENNSYIEGNVVRILYESSTGYKVGLFRVKSSSEDLKEFVSRTITFTGNFVSLNSELTYMFKGSLVTHPRFGLQFNVKEYSNVVPSTTDGLISYLSSGIFKGIGEKTAKKIVDTFKENTIEEIKAKNPLLLKIKGMNEKKLNELSNKMNEFEKEQEIILEFNKLGFTTDESLKIINKYKSRCFDIIENNIYALENDINFLKLDKIYTSFHNEFDNIRVSALIKYSIKNMCYETGNTLVDKESLYLYMSKFFNDTLPSTLFLSTLEDLITTMEVVKVKEYITLNYIYETETSVASSIDYLTKITDVNSKEKIESMINTYEKVNDIKFNTDQKNAVINSLTNNFFIISGGPGTGKTTIIKAVVDIYEQLNPSITSSDITLLAPTGRASKRLSESVLRKTSTIHKFLKWNKETKEFSVNRFNPVKTKLVIIDEVSMVDIFLFNSLLDGLVPNIKLILVGDANQLPSIAPGNILKDLLEVEKLPKIYLTEIYRTKKDSYIISLSTLIKERYEFTSIPEKHDDFNFINTQDLLIRNYLTEILLKAKEKDLNIDNLQVLVPMYKGENGIDSINALMQDIFNKETDSKNEIIIRNTLFREQDKVIQLVNDVDNNIYNGDIGYISRIINSKNPIVEINYNGNIVSYTKNKFEEFSLAYAISVHKSQGSEYDNVILVLPKSMKRMLYNKLIYTAVTRAKKSLIIVGSLDSLNYSIKENTSENRLTSLKTFFV